jgi:transposase InsO family protein
VTRFGHVDDQKAAGFPVTAACEAAGVSTSGYYDWREREAAGPTERQLAEAELVALMRDLFAEADENYGVPRMFKTLRKAGLAINRKRVARLMRLHGMAGRHRRRTCRTTFPGPTATRSPTSSAGGSPPVDLMWRGARTSPTSRPVRDGCTWPRSSTSGPGGCSATRWPATCAPTSSSTR